MVMLSFQDALYNRRDRVTEVVGNGHVVLNQELNLTEFQVRNDAVQYTKFM
jgi:hypothetical protein